MTEQKLLQLNLMHQKLDAARKAKMDANLENALYEFAGVDQGTLIEITEQIKQAQSIIDQALQKKIDVLEKQFAEA